MKLALEALKKGVDGQTSIEMDEAITSLRQAIAAPVQEPVGYVAENGVVDWNVCAPPILTDLYTTPPQRTWVKLTDEEVESCWRQVQANDFHDCVQPFARDIEAKLKAKNFA
jgi:hypothetical protein